MELNNLRLREIRMKSPYPAMIRYVLSKFPDMRFQDCFVDGNDWSKGNDRYRDDHPVMQFVARQLQLMNTGVSRKEAFEQTKEEYLARRMELEKQQKLEMALAQNQRLVPAFGNTQFVSPLYTTGAALGRQREAQLEVAHLNHIRRKLRMLRKEVEPHDRRRMSAKEVALDVEAERAGLLPRLSPSEYRPESPAVAETTTASTEAAFQESDEEEEDLGEFELFAPPSDESDWTPSVVSDVIEPSILNETGRGRKPRPIDVSQSSEWERQSERSTNLISTETKKTSEPLLKKREDSRPAQAILKSVKPAFTLSRPDKNTVQAILARKKKEELQRRIGKEPGENEDDGLDFEDFVNAINKSKK